MQVAERAGGLSYMLGVALLPWGVVFRMSCMGRAAACRKCVIVKISIDLRCRRMYAPLLPTGSSSLLSVELLRGAPGVGNPASDARPDMRQFSWYWLAVSHAAMRARGTEREQSFACNNQRLAIGKQ